MAELRTDRLTIKISPTLKDQARQAAAKEGRTLSNWIEQLIIKELKSQP